MKTIDIKGTKRAETGKKATKQLRKEGVVPCNLYGEARGENGLPVALSFAVPASGLRKLVYTPEIYTVNLDIDGKQYSAVMRELQFHPVSDQLLHVDFYEVTPEKPIVMEVPIKLNGLAEGVRAVGPRERGLSKVVEHNQFLPLPVNLRRCGANAKRLGWGTGSARKQGGQRCEKENPVHLRV